MSFAKNCRIACGFIYRCAVSQRISLYHGSDY